LEEEKKQIKNKLDEEKAKKESEPKEENAEEISEDSIKITNPVVSSSAGAGFFDDFVNPDQPDEGERGNR
jgi:hypothetical protein